MSDSQKIYLNHLGLISCIGEGQQAHLKAFLEGDQSFFTVTDEFSKGKPQTVGAISCPLPEVPAHLSLYQCRNSQLLLAALAQINDSIMKAIKKYGAHRVAVIGASSTTGIKECEGLFAGTPKDKILIPKIQEMGAVSEFVFLYYKLKSFHYTISTACSSSAKIIATAHRLLTSDLCDAVITIAADTLSQLTVQGFDSLEAVSKNPCLPFSKNRRGINLGEAAAAFLITREPDQESIFLAGYGEASDAHHMSAPDPEGKGGKIAIENSLKMANLSPRDIHYINLHGTGTDLNDAMEGKITYELFGGNTPCSSSKSLTGHTLGTSGILESAFCWLLLSTKNTGKKLPVHFWDHVKDPEIPPILLGQANMVFPPAKIWYTLSNSFAFGGNNGSIILGKNSN